MPEYTCDRCPTEVPDGAGNYIGDDRVCAECAKVSEAEAQADRLLYGGDRQPW